jgi:hypothetical protein
MVTVDLRFQGEGIWRSMCLPVSIQLAQTLAAVATDLELGHEVAIVPATGADPKLDMNV